MHNRHPLESLDFHISTSLFQRVAAGRRLPYSVSHGGRCGLPSTLDRKDRP
ncbi:hypothetical protein BIFBRE_04575 [Bifidobacterium breve DSM 20213 = JCM 1192]|uniref:Uncharacterized protein n=1 Tax=Bifidobacterium breve DSM 20213 = JCM 1192 TaxID=518634 RepID=D4BR42_BIFBR|nr:hypothetical protein BIFBRE_04575 [Bifidobacterium breve DSM 20213 = JCM 1192]